MKEMVQREIITKKEVLDNVRVLLKKEFIGIDKVIDEVIEVCSGTGFIYNDFCCDECICRK